MSAWRSKGNGNSDPKLRMIRRASNMAATKFGGANIKKTGHFAPRPVTLASVKPIHEYTAQECASRLYHLADKAVSGAEWIHNSASKLFRRAADLLSAPPKTKPAKRRPAAAQPPIQREGETS